jgi:hypothetical protein
MAQMGSYDDATTLASTDTLLGLVGGETKDIPVSVLSAMVSDSVTLVTETASYTLALTDAGNVVEMNVAGANDLTVPPNNTVAFPVGTQVTIVQYGAGQTTVVAGDGVTIRTAETLLLAARYTAVTLYKRATNEWVLVGNTEAA